MRRFILFVIFILLCSFAMPLLSTFAASTSLGGISAHSACLIEAESGKVLYGKNEQKQMPMASTTKIMTAIVALESGIPLDTRIKVPSEAVGVEGSSIYLDHGESITMEELIYGLLLCSANDAAVAISIAAYGSVEDFVFKMNEKALELGLSNTHFENPHGLDSQNHYTTAYDLARLMAYCVENETFLKISGTEKCTFPMGESETRVMINHNRLLREDIGVISGKTGFTQRSGRCLVSVAVRNGMRLVCVSLNAPNDWNDHRALFNFGFASYKKVCFEAVSMLLPVISGTRSEIMVGSESFSMILPYDYEKIEMRIEAPRFLFAPIKGGERIGKVVYICDGKEIATSPIYAREDIIKQEYKFNLFEWLIELFYKLKDL